MERFSVKPGERAVPLEGEGNPLLIFDGVPDVVRLPPQLGGQEVRVRHGHRGPCPCGKHNSLILVLDEPTGIQVAECATQFLWFRHKEK